MAAKAFDREPDRYVLRIDGEIIATADYSVSGDVVAITRVFTRPTHRGQGIAAEITQFAVEDIARDPAKRIQPVCWYAAQWFDNHPERKELLA